MPVEFSNEQMAKVWEAVAGLARGYRTDVASLPVSPVLNPEGIRAELAGFDLVSGQPWERVLAWIDGQMRSNQVHTGHPRYYGLFNPAPVPMGIAADALTAAYNPQLAAWSHSPFANELERHLIREFAVRFGFERESADGTFCSGGAESNHTGLLCALNAQFPEYAERGARGLTGQPVFYVSGDAHHSWVKAARCSGIGTDAVRVVSMNAAAVSHAIAEDRARGLLPFLVCATAGTTNAGLIDPLHEVAEVCGREGLWYHVDAAWGGAACIVPEYRGWLDGVERADSITFDAHKFLSVPMASGVFLTRHRTALDRAFRIQTDYMPRDARGMDVADPYAHSMQWSRRFIGLKVFLPIAVAGWNGYAETIRHQVRMGQRLRELLQEDGWQVVNDTPLPIVCFFRDGVDVGKIVGLIQASGEAWISQVDIARPLLRACVTNFRTEESDLVALVQSLRGARSLSERDAQVNQVVA